jgi:hypothetical protein
MPVNLCATDPLQLNVVPGICQDTALARERELTSLPEAERESEWLGVEADVRPAG